MAKLSLRLRTVLQQMPVGEPLWDFCCDHGYLAEEALRTGLYSEVHFVDQVPHILEGIRRRLDESEIYYDPDEVFFHCLPGEEITRALKGGISITGVGGDTIQKMLAIWAEKGLLQADVVVLGPHRDAALMEGWLAKQVWGYHLDEILTVEERGRERKLFILKRSR